MSFLVWPSRLIPLLENAGLFYEVHIFVDTENAPGDAIGTTVLKLGHELNATAVVLAANDTASLAVPMQHIVHISTKQSPENLDWMGRCSKCKDGGVRCLTS